MDVDHPTPALPERAVTTTVVPTTSVESVVEVSNSVHNIQHGRTPMVISFSQEQSPISPQSFKEQQYPQAKEQQQQEPMMMSESLSLSTEEMDKDIQHATAPHARSPPPTMTTPQVPTSNDKKNTDDDPMVTGSSPSPLVSDATSVSSTSSNNSVGVVSEYDKEIPRATTTSSPAATPPRRLPKMENSAANLLLLLAQGSSCIAT